MFRIEEIGYSVLIILLPLMLLLKIYMQSRSQKLWSSLGNLVQLKKSVSSDSKVAYRKFIFLCISLFLIVITLANPQFGQKREKVKSQNAEIFIALDVSQSMEASDIKPSRIARAKLLIKQITEKFSADKIGLISFAGDAYLQSPLTTDIATIQLLSDMLTPSAMPAQGTSISSALKMAIKSFPKKDGFHKMLILISDGEDHEGESLEIAKQAAKEGITIISIPIGTEEGSYVPNPPGSVEAYKRDKSGELIKTRPNRALLQEISEAGGGMLLEIEQGENLYTELRKKMGNMMKKDLSYQSFNDYESYYQFPLFLALVLLILDGFLNYKKDFAK